MYSADIIIEAVLNGLLTGAIYALVALGLTLVYGVLHIINFAHGALLAAAMFAVLLVNQLFGIDPYAQVPFQTVIFFALGFGLQRLVIGPASHGKDENILLVTLGLSIVIENLLLVGFGSDTRSLNTDYSFAVFEVGPYLLSQARVFGAIGALATAALLWLFLARSDTGKAIRAVAREKIGARLQGIDVAHVYAVTFGLGCACLAVSACLLLPTYYVNPRIGGAYVLVAFTIVVLGGMGSIVGAMLGGLVIGVVESMSGLFLGDSLGQIGIFLIFILTLLLRPTGLFGARA